MPGSKIVSVGPDWVTLTSTDPVVSVALQSVAWAWMMGMALEGEVPRKWAAMGYQGWQQGHVRFGIRGPDEAILIASGEDTGHLLELQDLPPVRVVRFDVQVTVSIDPHDTLVARDLYYKLKKDKLSNPNAPDCRYVSSPTGDTCYIGRRGREKFLRIYDKTFAYEPGHTGIFWRYEVEYKRGAARTAYDAWQAAPSKELWGLGIVAAELKNRGVSGMYNHGTEIDAIELKQTVSTIEGKLEWLSRCVSPVVVQLVNLGYTDDIIHVLKLRHILNKEQQ